MSTSVLESAVTTRARCETADQRDEAPSEGDGREGAVRHAGLGELSRTKHEADKQKKWRVRVPFVPLYARSLARRLEHYTAW